MEGFGGSGNAKCVEEAQSFLNGWDKYIAQTGHSGEVAGVYGSVDSPCPGGSDLPAYASIGYVPDYIFGADWGTSDNTDEMGGCLGSDWTDKQRLKQYEGEVSIEEKGSVLRVDEDSANGPVYVYPPES